MVVFRPSRVYDTWMTQPRITILPRISLLLLLATLLLSGKPAWTIDLAARFAATGRQCATGTAMSPVGKTAISISDSSGGFDVMFLNADGSAQSTRSVRGSGALFPFAIAATPDNGFVVVGSIQTSAAGTDGFVAKISSTGGLLWKKSIGTSENDELRSVAVMPDGSIAVVGHRQSSVSSFDLLVARFSASGGLQWKKVLGTNGFEHAGAVTATPDGSLMLSAATDSGGTNRGLWIKLAGGGTVISSQTSSTPDSAGLSYLEDANLGRVYVSLAPLRQDVNGKTLIARFDSQNRRLWSKSLGAAGASVNVAPGFFVSDGSVVLAGNAFTFGASPDKAVLLKISPNGVLQWKRTFTSAQSSSSFAGPVMNPAAQSLLAAGCVDSGLETEDMILVNLPLSGNTGTSCASLPTISISNSSSTFTLSNLPVSTLPATIHSLTISLTSAPLVTTKTTLCTR